MRPERGGVLPKHRLATESKGGEGNQAGHDSAARQDRLPHRLQTNRQAVLP